VYAFAGSFLDARFARVGLDFFVVVAEENGARPPPFAVRAIFVCYNSPITSDCRWV
jgi:hypothetical protein